MVVFGTALTGLLMVAQQSGGTIASENITSPKYHNYDFESACGGTVFRVRFRNGSRGGSRVDHVMIDGRPVPGAAKILDRFAARQRIDRIEIMHCGLDPLRPIFRGIAALARPESQRSTKENMLFFRLVRQDKGWRMTVG